MNNLLENITEEELKEIIAEELSETLVLVEKCWKGYEKKGMKKMFGKMYQNCVKKKKGKKRKKRKKRRNENIKGEINEVYSDKQRRFMCAVSKQGAKRPKGLTKAAAKEMCKGPMKDPDPKKGTGKKPKGSGRRLYTDENPSDTVSVKFSTVQDIKDTLSKDSFKSKSHKRQSQIINLIHQRARAAYQNAKDPKVKARLKKSFDYAKQRKEASKRKTQTMNKAKKDE